MNKDKTQRTVPPPQGPANARRPRPAPAQGPAQGPAGASAQQPGGTPPLDLNVVTKIDMGRTREIQEDCVDYYIPADPQQRARKGAIYLVADGMGGHQAGEVASQGAVKTVITQYYSDVTHDVDASLVQAFRTANRQIYQQAQADPAKSGMGTTLVAAVILGRKVYVANVGDSRAYLISQKGITQITEDHSWVAEQVRAELLTPAQARRHPQRNVVTRALGSKPAVEVDLFQGEINEGDALLLCTDGLTGHVEDAELAAIVRKHPPQEAQEVLVNLANERGGQDNMGLILVSAQERAGPAPAAVRARAAKGKAARAFPLIPALAGVAALLLVVLAGGWGVSRLRDSRESRATGTAIALLSTEAATATWTPTSTPEPTPTPEEPTLAPSEAASPAVAGGTPTPPTATLAPTHTPSPPKPTSGRTPTGPQAPTNTPKPPSGSSYPAPILVTPEANADGLHGSVRFAWHWPHSKKLGADNYYELRIWCAADLEAGGEGRRGVRPPTKALEDTVNLDYVQTIVEHGAGVYYWGVVVVEKRCPGSTCDHPRIVGDWSERQFTYTPTSEPPGPTGPTGPTGPEEPEEPTGPTGPERPTKTPIP